MHNHYSYSYQQILSFFLSFQYQVPIQVSIRACMLALLQCMFLSLPKKRRSINNQSIIREYQSLFILSHSKPFPSRFKYACLNHTIITPTPLPSQLLSRLHILPNLILSQAINTAPIGTTCASPELAKAIFALAEHLFHIKRPWISEDRCWVFGFLACELIAESG